MQTPSTRSNRAVVLRYRITGLRRKKYTDETSE